MSEHTSTTDAAITAGAARGHERIAFMAIATHLFEHQLDVPHSIAIDRHGPNAGRIVVAVHHESADAWVESIAIDAHTTEPVSNRDIFNKPMLRHRVEGRLPDLGIRVQLRFFEVLETTKPRLQSVGA